MEKLFQIGRIIVMVSVLNQLCLLVVALRCHDCTNLEGVGDFMSECAGPEGIMTLKGGYAGCLKVMVVSDAGESGVIRSGYYNKQMEGRVLSCYHQTFECHLTSRSSHLPQCSHVTCAMTTTAATAQST